MRPMLSCMRIRTSIIAFSFVIFAPYRCFFSQAEDGIRKYKVTGVQTCALPICQDSETGRRIRKLASGEERWLAHPIQRDEQESLASMDVLPGYAFTPDSLAIVISYGGEIRIEQRPVRDG